MYFPPTWRLEKTIIRLIKLQFHFYRLDVKYDSFHKLKSKTCNEFWNSMLIVISRTNYQFLRTYKWQFFHFYYDGVTIQAQYSRLKTNDESFCHSSISLLLKSLKNVADVYYSKDLLNKFLSGDYQQHLNSTTSLNFFQIITVWLD